MHQREDRWFPPAAGVDFSWQESDDRWLRLAVTLGGLSRTGRSSALDPATARNRSWSDSSSTLPSEPRLFTDSVHRLKNEATQGVAANENPHDDSRGLDSVAVKGVRYTMPDGYPPHVGLSRTRDGLLLDIPLVDREGRPVRLYGLGEKTGGLDKRGRTWVMWNTDEPVHTPDKSALYQSLPVVYLWTPENTVTLVIDSMATIWFDAGEGEPDRLLVEVYDPCFDLFLGRTETLPHAVERYTALTGRIPLPPEWALGFHQCRYSYLDERRLREVAERFRRESIPCDALYLDIHYMEGYRVFTWDHRRFPDPAGMVKALRAEGFRIVTIIDPGVKKDMDYPVFSSGLKEDLYLRHPGGAVYTGAVWPGEAVFPDFSRSRTRAWWAEWHRTLFDAGVAGVWNDMNEPADFSGDEHLRVDFTVPDELVADNDGEPVSFGRVHNEYANGMNRATRIAFEKYRPEERGFVLTRAGAAGIQRYAAIWTGDNHSWWEHLAGMIPMFCNVGLSGAAFVGGDAGGFQLNADAELYSRWIAAAAFTPFFRAHSALDTRDHEPWSFGESALAVARRYIGLRYRLLPYIYTLFEEASRTGAPVMRPLVWEFPNDPRVEARADSFMLGEALLVAPVREAGVYERSVYLPAGTWYDFWTGERVHLPSRADGSGGAVLAEAPLDRLPLYVRGGCIIPFETERQHTGEVGDGILRFLVAPDEAGCALGSVYADAGEGFGYRRGECLRANVRWAAERLSFEIGDARSDTGLHWRSYAVVSVGRVGGHRRMVLDGEARESGDLTWKQ
jgi:alpha-glucosidase